MGSGLYISTPQDKKIEKHVERRAEYEFTVQQVAVVPLDGSGENSLYMTELFRIPIQTFLSYIYIYTDFFPQLPSNGTTVTCWTKNSYIQTNLKCALWNKEADIYIYTRPSYITIYIYHGIYTHR